MAVGARTLTGHLHASRIIESEHALAFVVLATVQCGLHRMLPKYGVCAHELVLQ